MVLVKTGGFCSFFLHFCTDGFPKTDVMNGTPRFVQQIKMSDYENEGWTRDQKEFVSSSVSLKQVWLNNDICW